ncbi:hypothetical protein AHAS_Ahas17G0140200 [Arachis hypogaea]
MKDAWLLMGDFNDITNEKEKKGRDRNDIDRVFERMDRAFANPEWCTTFPYAVVNVLPRTQINNPSMTCLDLGRFDAGEKSFCFEALWKSHENFGGPIKENWRTDMDVPIALNLTEKLKK